MQKFGVNIPPIGDALSKFFEKYKNDAGELAKTVGSAYAVIKNDTVRNLVDPTKDAASVVATLPAPFTALNTALKGLVTTENLARTAIYATSDASLTFSERIKEANKVANDYPAALGRSAGATGFFTTELQAVDKAAAIIPGAFNEMKISARDFGGVLESKAINPSHATMVALRGLGIEAGNMGEQVVTMYKDFGQSGKPAIESLAGIAQAGQLVSSALGTKFSAKLAYDQISELSKPFGIFGGTVSSAAETWVDFNTALGKTVPVNQINSMVSTVTKGIATMSLQHRAFMTQVSGAQPGTSMIGGALKMEMAMRTPEGMGKNMQALTDTLSQFGGGNIITIDQAVKMPELETQFVMQREMLKQLTGVTGNEEQNRVLEVLKKTQQGGMSQIDASKEVGNLMKGGVSLQQQSVTHLETLVQIGRQTIGPIQDGIKKIDQAVKGDTKTGAGGMSRRMAATTEGRSMPYDAQVVSTLDDIFSNMAKPNEKFETPGGMPDLKGGELGSGGGGMGVSLPMYDKTGRQDSRAIQRRQQYTISGQRTSRKGTQAVSARPRATAGIKTALTTIEALEKAIKANTKITQKELETPIRLELVESCPGCSMEKIKKVVGQRTGVGKGA